MASRAPHDVSELSSSDSGESEGKQQSVHNASGTDSQGSSQNSDSESGE